MAEIIKPCPFCGDPMKNNVGIVQHVDQDDCPIGAIGLPVELVGKWNRRAILLEEGQGDG